MKASDSFLFILTVIFFSGTMNEVKKKLSEWISFS